MKNNMTFYKGIANLSLITASLFLFFVVKNELSPNHLFIFAVQTIIGSVCISLLVHHLIKSKQLIFHIGQEEEKQRIAAKNMTEMLAVIDQKGVIQSCSPSHARKIGAVSTTTNFYQLIHSEDEEKVVALIQSVFIKGEEIETEFRMKHKYGYWINIEINASPFSNEHGETDQVVLVYRDVTKRKEDEEKLLETIKNFQDIRFALDESSLVQITDKHGILIYTNEKACQLSGYSLEEIMGKPMRVFNSHYHSREFFENLWKTVLNGNVWRGEIRNKTKSGGFFWVDTTIVPFLDKSGQPFQFIIIRTDITKSKENEKKLEYLSNVDGLTSLYNRRYFDRMLQQYWVSMMQRENPISIIIFDMDSFKSYNDYYGHIKGDECLILISKKAKELLDDSKTVLARYGGEEFSIILPGIDAKEAYYIADNIRAEIESLKIPHRKSEVNTYVTLSLGVASMVPKKDIEPNEVLMLADKALYQAKNNGRNTVVSNDVTLCSTI
ncbi:diguanylate cyclase domain-containing protein [Neobacillus sp.]|uniref:sensor domain-containing diguanylate cyclase n=1 Tax=Neobacillus sp. TaxID=2675273 RepID=UPI00289F9251|nr:diguanylate cyclase [Neobacillus sp.]